MTINISSKYTDEKINNPTVDDLIDIFEDRVINWLLEPAKKIMPDPTGPIPAFCLLLTYFEGIWIFIKGEDNKNKSSCFFKEAFIDVFASSGLESKTLGRVADVLYKEGRCGFFHDGMFRAKLYFKALKDHDMLITVPRVNEIPDENGEIKSIVIDPQKFYEAIQRHFDLFINKLRDKNNTSIRDVFEKTCEMKWNLSSDGTFIGMDYDEFLKT